MLKKIALVSFFSLLMLIGVLGTQRNFLTSADATSTLERWAIIEDVNGDQLKVETVSDAVWAELFQLHQNGSERWIGGIVETYDNEWGFRFDPGTIIVAEITVEAWQTTIRHISGNLNYWLGEMAVVWAGVVKIYVPQPVGGVAIPADKFALLTPYIGLTCVTLAISVASALYAKRKRSQKPEEVHHEE